MDLELQGSAPLSVQGEERVQGIGGHTAPEFRIQQDTKHFQRFLRSMNVPIQSDPHLSLVTLDITIMHFLAVFRVFVWKK